MSNEIVSPRTPTRLFENEHGREILIDVTEMDGEVLIVMEGPASSATNLVTPREAEMLRQALNDWAHLATRKEDPTP